MSTATAGIVEAVKQDIVGVIKDSGANVGNVYDRVKYSSNWQNFKDQFTFVDPGTGYTQLRGWWITLPTINEYGAGNSFDTHWHSYTYPIRAILSYSDKGDTEPDFNNMIWSVFDLLHDQGVLGHGFDGVNDYVIDAAIDVEVRNVDLRFFGSILCHHAEFRVTVGIGQGVAYLP